MKGRRAFKAVCLLVVLAAVVQTGWSVYLSRMHRKEQAALADMTEQMKVETGLCRAVSRAEESGKQVEQEPEEQEPVILSRFEPLLTENEDVVGWLTLEGTKVDYPVMQCEDAEYYLHHDFYGEEDKYGCLYVRERADVNAPGTNAIIYGHNMKDGSMFGELDLYREESFFRKHPRFRFDTLYEERTYEIMAVFLSQVYRENEDVFKYYQFYEAETEAEFQNFYESVKALSLYDTGVTAEYGDTFLTLSTCAYHVEDGRLAIVAKRISE